MNKVTHKNIKHYILKFLKDFEDIEIITNEDDELVIEYGWSNYEESNSNIVTINYKEFTIQNKEEGYSVYGGEYSFNDIMTFINEQDLYANFCKGIREYFSE